MSQEEESAIKKPELDAEDATESFYLRYYSGHQGRFGHEFLGTYYSIHVNTRAIENRLLTLRLEFDVELNEDKKSALVRYTNNSNYRRDELIRKECEWIKHKN